MLRSCLPYLLLVPPMAAQAPAGVAMVTDLQGKASIQQGNLVEDLVLTAELAPGRKVQVAAGARLTLVSFGTGDQIHVTGPAAFTLDGEGRARGPKQRIQVVPVKGVKLQEALKPGGLAQASLVMRASWEGDIAMLQPGSAAVLEPFHRFAWAGAGEGAHYTFTLKDSQGRDVASVATQEPAYHLPANQSLLAGATYTWSITAEPREGTPRRAQGTFKVLSLPQRGLLLNLRALGRSSFSLRLAYAAALQQFGLQEEAKAEWRALRQERPGDPVLKAFAQ